MVSARINRNAALVLLLCCRCSQDPAAPPPPPPPTDAIRSDVDGGGPPADPAVTETWVDVRLGTFQLQGQAPADDGFGGDDRPILEAAGMTLPSTDRFGFVEADPRRFRFAGSTSLAYGRNHRFADGQADRSARHGDERIELPILRLHNAHLVVELMPILGGRIWDIRRPGGPSQLYHSRNIGDPLPRIIPVSYGMLQWWLNAGGAEVSFPWAEHGAVFYKPFAYRIVSATYPAKVTQRAAAIGRDGQPRTIEVTFTLGERDRSLRVDVSVTGPGTGGYQAWINAQVAPGIGADGRDDVINRDVRFIGSVTSVRYHTPEHPGEPDAVGPGTLGATGGFPVWDDKDLSSYERWLGYRDVGLFAQAFDGAPYFGAYSPSGGGLVRSVLGAAETGIKLWCFGKDLLTDGADRYSDVTQPDVVTQSATDAYFEIWTSGNTSWFGDNWVGDGGYRDADASWTERWAIVDGSGAFDSQILVIAGDG